MEIYCALPRNGLVWEPSIFPWHKTELKAAPVIAQLALTAYVLQDQEKITRTAELIKDMPAFQGQSCRGLLVNLLLNEPSNEEQRELLVSYVGNQEEHTSFIAWELLKRMKLEEREYAILEDMLRYKRPPLIKRVTQLLLRQEAHLLEASLKRLIEDEREEKRAGALDMLMRLQKDKDRQDLYEKVKALPLALHNPTDKERLLIEELTAREGQARTLTRENGYGLYDPGVRPPSGRMKPEMDVLKKCLPLTEAEAAARLIKLDQLLALHSGLEYMACTGEMTLLGNEYLPFKGLGRLHLDNYPLAHELREFYETEIQSFEALMELYALLFLSFTGPDFYLAGADFYKGVWGRTPFTPPWSLRRNACCQRTAAVSWIYTRTL